MVYICGNQGLEMERSGKTRQQAASDNRRNSKHEPRRTSTENHVEFEKTTKRQRQNATWLFFINIQSNSFISSIFIVSWVVVTCIDGWFGRRRSLIVGMGKRRKRSWRDESREVFFFAKRSGDRAPARRAQDVLKKSQDTNHQKFEATENSRSERCADVHSAHFPAKRVSGYSIFQLLY